MGRLRLALANRAQELGDLILPTSPHFLWVTEFPLFTRADEDKEFLAKGRWSSSHHPFTAPMWQDIEKMYAGQIDEVRLPCLCGGKFVDVTLFPVRCEDNIMTSC